MKGPFEEFVDDEELAAALDVSTRTIHRRKSEPDGLPHVEFGGKVLFHLPSVREYLLKRQRQRNPTRKPRSGGSSKVGGAA